MQVLVTGATGFIGSNLVESLLKKGCQIYVLVRHKINYPFLKHKNVKIIFGDLLSLDHIKSKLRPVDIVFHLAGSLPHHHLPEKIYWDTNVKGVKNLLEVYKRSNLKRFVYVSTTGIYGSTPKIGTDENSSLHLDSVYAKTKAMGEHLVYSAYKKNKLPIVIIRPTIAYGPGDKRPGFSNLFPLIKKKLFIPVGNGHNFFHTIYVENLIDALMLAVSKQEAIGEDFIIGDDPCPTMKEIVETIATVEGSKVWPFYIPKSIALGIGKFFDVAQKFGVPAILNTQRVKFITENKRFDVSKAKKILGYKAKVNLREGIEKTYQWYQKNKYL